MENKRQSGSLPSELFGTKEQPSTDVFASIFPPPKGAGKNSTASEMTGSSARRDDMDKNGQQPCHMSSSIYYGGREPYFQPKNSNASGTSKKDAGEDDGASRGNWWQGSLYY